MWEVSGGRAKGRSLEADRINRHLDDIRTQIGKSLSGYLRPGKSYVTAEKVKNAYLGFGENITAPCCLEAFEQIHRTTCKERIGIDRSPRYMEPLSMQSIDTPAGRFMRKEYNV